MTAKLRRVHFPNVGEGVIYKPGGVPYEQHDEALVPYGSYVRLGNKGFVYAKAYTLLDTAFGAIASKAQKLGQMVLAADIKAGDTVVTITVTATNSIDLNELADGELVCFANTIDVFNRGIVSNTKIVTSGTMTVVLDSPVPVDVDAGGKVEAIISPYANVFNTGGGEAPGWFHMVLGMPTYPAEAGKSLWLQVTGPCWVVPDILVGANDGDIEVVFGSNGSLTVRNTTTPAPGKFLAQTAGYIIAAASGGGQGAPFIMLDIAH